MQATLLKTVCVRLTFQENKLEGDSLKKTLYICHILIILWSNLFIKHSHIYRLKCILSYLQTPPTLILYLRRNHFFKKKLRICDIFLWKIAWFSMNKSVYESEHWRKSPRIVIHAYNICGHNRHRHILTSWMGLMYNRLSSERSNRWFY